ncbi:MAG TPA: EAL domain-containing protein [Burkholderiales bacterium]|nr:EAL domain-containing protein [Burkholderiales bacterium]
MDEREIRVLIVEDAPADAELCQRELRRAGIRFTARCVEREPEFERALIEFTPDLILSDFSMPTAFDGLTALDLTRAKSTDIPFVFVSGTIGEDRAVEAMRRGATDYVLKDRLGRLGPVVRRAMQEAEERKARRKAEEEIERQRAFLRQVIDLDRARIFAKDREGRFTLANQALAEAYGCAVEDVLGRTSADFSADPELVERSRRTDLEVFATRREVVIPEQFVRDQQGNDRWFQVSKRPVIGADGTVDMVLVVATEITERKLQELRIGRLNRILAVLSDINAAIVRIRDRQHLFEEACRIAVEHGGFGMAWIGRYEAASLEITPVAGAGLAADSTLMSNGLILRGSVPQSRGMIARLIEEGRPVFCNDITREPEVGGERRAEAIRCGYRSVISLPLVVEAAVVGTMTLYAKEPDFFDDEEVKLLTGLADDISFALDHIGKEEQLSYLAYYDVLTGLPNRTLFQDRLEQRVSLARRDEKVFSVMMLDIERFRHINDTLGRQAGDGLLRAFSLRLKATLGETDILAHVGGDYFAVASRRTEGAAEVVHLLEQILAGAAGRPYAVSGSDLRIAARAGVVLYPSDGADAESLLRNAEAALKDAKRTGNQYLFYAPQMNARVAEQLKLENDLRRAVLEEQFVLYYQPRMDLAGGRICGFEALIRWRHPERGLIAPGEFIPVLEATGMILEVGRWALRRAAQDHAAWRAAALDPPRIAVNVSAVQLRRGEFVEEVRAALAETGGFRHIDIEITESMLMEDIEGNIGKLKALQEMGLNVAMDDFGTGYCSLSYLAKLPINSLKVDRSFIAPMAQGAEQMAIVSTIISLARALNLKVVAEGVETREQTNLLRLLRCDEVQGYLFARPEPVEQAAERMKKEGRR